MIHRLVSQELLQFCSVTQVDLSNPINFSPDQLKSLWKQLFETIAQKYRQNPTIYPTLSSFKGDPLGTLYAFFLQNELNFEESQGNLIIQKKNQKMQGFGTVYTPFEVVTVMVHHLQTIVTSQPLRDKYKIADIACGTGRFLGEWQALAGNRCTCEFFGYDIDKTALDIAQDSDFSDSKTHWFHQDVLIDNEMQTTNQYDIILGNPPYIESRAIPDDYWDHIRKNYQSAYKKFDLSVIFLEKTVRLLRPGGWGGVIVSNKWLVSDYGEKIRKLLLTDTYIESIVDVSHLSVFRGFSTYPIIIFFQKLPSPTVPSKTISIFQPQSLTDLSRGISQLTPIQIPQEYFLNLPKHLILTNLSPPTLQILTHMSELLIEDKAFRLGDLASPYTLRKGIHTGNIKDKIFVTEDLTKPTIKKGITSRFKVERYKIVWNNLWIDYDPIKIDKSKGEYGSFRDEWIFQANPKIVIKLFGETLQAALDQKQYYANNSLILLIPRPHDSKPSLESEGATFESPQEEFYYILGVLNSDLITKYYRGLFSATHVRGDYLQYYVKDLNQIPLMKPSQATIETMKAIAVLAQLLETIYAKSSASSTNTDTESDTKRYETELNMLVEHLYGLPE